MLNKRIKLKNNNYPIHSSYRELTSVLRDSDGYLVFPTILNNNIIFNKTNIKDIPSIIPNKKGQRGFTKKYLHILQESIIDLNFKGDLFMYCIHEINQILRPISDFTTNKIYPTTVIKIDDFGNNISLQPFCKESKKKYVNSGPAGNSSRTKDQFLEDTGSRFRTKIIESITKNRPKIVYNEIYKKFKGCCFKCKSKISYNESSGVKSNLDHTLPHSLYYPYTTSNSTLLCVNCNQSKKGHWPSEFYSKNELKKLSKITGISYDLLSGSKKYNSELLIKFSTEFKNVIDNIEKRFRKRNEENRIKIFQKIKKDMFNFGNIQPEFEKLSNSIVVQLDNYIQQNYVKYE
jgi:5-methylcytosine-specific restriction endonuclease McrA